MDQIVIIIGHLGGDPEMRFTPSGTEVTTFSVATNYTYKKDGENIKETTWWRCTVWGNTANLCNDVLSKGDIVKVQGRMNQDKKTGGPRIWKKDNGEVSASYELIVDNIRFISTKKRGAKTEDTE